jgi:23S rRNA (adenine2030-N6)-methyltransferase
MNYRHAFHAGNFADVFKHAVLVRILLHLRAKPAPFRVIDTHAGAGFYDLAGAEPSRSPEWRDGIGRILERPLAPEAAALLAPYLDLVAGFNPAGPPTIYPGSPALVRGLLRSQDRLIACELEPRAAAVLERRFTGDRRVKTLAIDGWTALNAFIPPKERRGLVLIDPPFEQADEFRRLGRALEAAHRKWASGIYLSWYPIKERTGPDLLARQLSRSGLRKLLRVELDLGSSRDPGRLAACGLIVVNPPWTLENELARMLPALTAALATDGRGRHRLDWLAGEI